MKNVKRLLAIMTVIAMMFSITACSKEEPKEETKEEETEEEATENETGEAEEEEAEAETSSEAEAEGEEAAEGTDEEGEVTEIQIANPWTEVETLEAACEGSGVSFDMVNGMEISIGEVVPYTYRYMDGLVEIEAPTGAVELLIRKGLAPEDGDISGDYNSYAYEWTQNVKGLEVRCFGNREGEATKTIWTLEDMAYSILAYGAGGDSDFGLNPDDLNSLINGMQ